MLIVVAALGGVVASCTGGGASPDGGVDADAALPDAVDASVDAGAPASCDPVAQDCPEGKKCSLVPSEDPDEPLAPGCVDDIGSRGPLEDCRPATPDMPDDCARGLVCRGEGEPHCLEFCESEPKDTCPDDYLCAFDVDLDDDTFVDVQFCARSCDPLAQDCGDPSLACYPSRRGTVCAPEGAGDTPVPEGGFCPYANSCERGLGCFGSGSDWYCYRMCDPDDGVPGCASGQACARVESETWGICVDV